MISESLTKAAVSSSLNVVYKTDVFEDIKEKINDFYIHFKLDDTKINKILYDYLVYIHRKCCYINTIINPNENISLKKIYEPIFLKQISTEINNEKSLMLENIDANMILNDYIDNNIIISDTAGIGKSTFSKYLVLELLRNDKIKKFPIFVELRKIEQKQNLKNYFIQEINNASKNKITEKTFNHLFAKNIFMFILDGFDEIDEANKSFLLEEINNFSTNHYNNTIILTTRKQEVLPTLYQKSLYQFETLNMNQIINILINLDKAYNKDIGEQIIKHNEFNSLDFTLFETPLMINLLYVYFSYSHDIDNSIVNFYDELFSALYKGHDLTKENYKRNKKSGLNLLDFRKLFTAFSFIAIYNNNISYRSDIDILNSINTASEISGIKVNCPEYFLEDMILSVPLIIKDGKEYKFVHKTIAEYFAAEYINFPENSTISFSKIKLNNKELQFKKTFEFIYEINYNLFLNEVASEYLEDYINLYKNEHTPTFSMMTSIYEDIDILFIKTELSQQRMNEELNKFSDQKDIKNRAIIFKKDKVVSFGKINKYYQYLPRKFFKSILSESKENVFFNQFETLKSYSLYSELFEYNLGNKSFRRSIYNMSELNDIGIDKDEVIDILKVKNLLKEGTKLKDNFNDLIN